jgi:hypothetical protein
VVLKGAIANPAGLTPKEVQLCIHELQRVLLPQGFRLCHDLHWVLFLELGNLLLFQLLFLLQFLLRPQQHHLL